MKICLYTAIYGGYELLNNHNPAITGVDFKCFTDDINIKSNMWDVTHLPNDVGVSPAMFYKRIKCKPEDYIDGSYDVTIWLDANFIIKDVGYINRLVSQLNDNSLLLYKHKCLAKKHRNCIYIEANYSKTLPRFVYGQELLDQQINDYRQDGYPDNNGLYQSGLIVRRHNCERVHEFNSFWLKQIYKYGKMRPQCQVSLPYSLWKTNVPFGLIEGNIWDTDIFEVKKHGTLEKYSPAYR